MQNVYIFERIWKVSSNFNEKKFEKVKKMMNFIWGRSNRVFGSFRKIFLKEIVLCIKSDVLLRYPVLISYRPIVSEVLNLCDKCVLGEMFDVSIDLR